jgi:hypothetical protein
MESVPTKDQCVTEYKRIRDYLMKDLEQKLTEAHAKGWSYIIKASVHGICRDLVLDKQLVIYLLMGSSAWRKTWGTLKETYDMDPLKYALRKEVSDKGRAVLSNMVFRLYFDNHNSDGDFKAKVTFNVYNPKKAVEEKGEETTLVVPPPTRRSSYVEKKTWAKVVKKEIPNKPVKAEREPVSDELRAGMDELRKQMRELQKRLEEVSTSKD